MRQLQSLPSSLQRCVLYRSAASVWDSMLRAIAPRTTARVNRCGVGLLLLTAVLAPATGCNSFGNSRLVKELQSENDRLLSEFRGQRDRASELEKANQLQAARLAESEKLLARLSQGSGAERLSSLPQSNYFGPSQPSVDAINTSQAVATPSSPGELRWQPRVGNR